MKREGLNRREFNRLTMAAFGGVVAGAVAGCGDSSTTKTGDAADKTGKSDEAKDGESVSLLLEEPHVCRGLNTCKGLGASKENDCAGQGTCASVAHHSCGGQNECKGQGGCGSKPGENTCKGEGACAVPLMEEAWPVTRKNFEAAMKAAGKEFGDAPPKA